MQRNIYLVLVLAAVSFGTVFYGLTSPNQVIFDEVHFGKFVTAYCCSHERIFDIHPPHAKLLIAGAGYLGGYRGGFAFDHISEDYGDTNPLPLRALPALAGACIPLMLYGMLRLFKVSPQFSFLGGLLVALDNALTVQSRVIGLDTILLLATFGSLWLFLIWLMRPPKRSSYRYALLIGSGLAAGLAAGTKFTGLVALGLIGIVLFIELLIAAWYRNQMWQKRIQQVIVAGLTILGSAFVIYVAGWVAHFMILDQPGSGDAWGVPTGNMVEDIIEIHQEMLKANYNLTATHSYSSFWWTWPAMVRPVFYWAGDSGNWIYFWGNPVVWWGSAVFFVAALCTYIVDRTARKKHPYLWVLPLGFILAYLPFVRIPRALFLYHYLTPLLFSILFFIWWLDIYVPKTLRKTVVVAISAIVAVAFVIFSPVTYGFDGWQQSLIWFSSWR